jgi:hypothetical protein
MNDPNHAPVSLAAGSYDYETLKKGLDKAATGAVDKYDGAVAKTLDDAATNVHQNQDARDIPGYKFVDVEREDLGVTETVQVFDPKLADEAQAASDDAISEAAPLNNQGKASAAAPKNTKE